MEEFPSWEWKVAEEVLYYDCKGGGRILWTPKDMFSYVCRRSRDTGRERAFDCLLVTGQLAKHATIGCKAMNVGKEKAMGREGIAAVLVAAERLLAYAVCVCGGQGR